LGRDHANWGQNTKIERTQKGGQHADQHGAEICEVALFPMYEKKCRENRGIKRKKRRKLLTSSLNTNQRGRPGR